ncbi:paeninodin family lasso peptide [Halobacillus litoralis]|nr:paeninodin family lasso peptide [Halobacillus litoralis]WLR49122.1 paeninodin family lasso peptide [Halobacillus litoralis]
MKKDWKQLALEVLDVTETMKGGGGNLNDKWDKWEDFFEDCLTGGEMDS